MRTSLLNVPLGTLVAQQRVELDFLILGREVLGA